MEQQKQFQKGWYQISFNLRLSESAGEDLELDLIRAFSNALSPLGFDLISSVFFKWVDEFDEFERN